MENRSFKLENNITLVTGLWDIGRGNLTDGWSRSYQHYLDKFSKLLEISNNLIIFGDKELESFVFDRRTVENTQFIVRDLSWFINNEYYDSIQNIRTNQNWYSRSGWLPESTQAKLELYNPLVMSKMFLIHDAKILDKFDSDYLFWIDAGIINTVHPGYFTHDKVIDKLSNHINKFTFVCFQYDGKEEIHGFDYQKLKELSNGLDVNKVARGGFFGGPKETITEVNSLYYSLMNSTLSDGYMGTEESLFTILCYKHPNLIDYFEIDSNGLLSKFFEDLKNDSLIVKNEKYLLPDDTLDISKVGLYVITFNSPNQFRTLIKSFIEYDKEYLTKTKKFLLDNSSNETTFDEYSELCKEYNFEHIKKDNLGICGGRQFIAEHFKETDLDYYLFFEDDMFFFTNEGVCRNGFNRYIPNLYSISLEIMKKENFDFIKLNYSEFFGDNGTQWAWYNVPQVVREEFWPGNPRLPVQGLDPNAPRAVYKNIISHRGVPYTNGEVYYSNWPQIVSRNGNKKMFLDTTWAHPYEQTWMSHMFQLTKKGELNGGLLLMTPTEHNRFEHYDGKLRKES